MLLREQAFDNVDEMLHGHMTEEQCRDLLLSTDIQWELEAEEVDKIIESINVCFLFTNRGSASAQNS